MFAAEKHEIMIGRLSRNDLNGIIARWETGKADSDHDFDLQKGYSTNLTTQSKSKLGLKMWYVSSSEIDIKKVTEHSYGCKKKNLFHNTDLSHNGGRHSGGGKPKAQPPGGCIDVSIAAS